MRKQILFALIFMPLMLQAETEASTEIDVDAAVLVAETLDGDSDVIDTMELIADTTSADTASVGIVVEKPTIVSPPVADTIQNENIPLSLLGFDIGLAIGNVSIFELWQESLPRTIAGLGFSANFGNDLADNDTMHLIFRVTESPDNFNFVVPFGLSFHRVGSEHAISLALSFFHASRQYQSLIFIDGSEVSRKIDLHETMTYTSLSLEAAYHKTINPALFSINGSRQSFFTLALGVSPVNIFSRSNDIKKTLSEDDARMNAVYDSLSARFSKLTGNGIAVTWRIGISTLRERGIIAGLYYSGTYVPGFYDGGDEIAAGRVNGNIDDGKSLAHLSSRVDFRITFTRPLRKNAAIKITDESEEIKDIIEEEEAQSEDDNGAEITDITEEVSDE